MAHFYLTTTLPYVNAEPHIGFALEIVAADVIARYHDSIGDTVFFNTGTDEHGQKIYEKALESNQTPQAYVDTFAQTFKDLQSQLNLYPNLHFIRTTDKQHILAAQEFWKRCSANRDESGKPDIYKAEYETLYCVGCELEKQASELENGKCPLHPTKALEKRTEENYFFRFSRYQKQLLDLYKNNPGFVHPEGKEKEITAFVENGIQDFSISRLAQKMPWGIPVPGDSDHVMYVWFDALINYISTLGWPNSPEFSQFWPGIQLAGKDNLRQQAAMWQAMLLSANVPNSSKILINGFISVNGQKMSKSLGNVISPTDMIARYGVEATRFLLLNLGPFGGDMDVSWEKFDVQYTAQLANRLGNWCSRVAKLCEKHSFSYSSTTLSDFSAELQTNQHRPYHSAVHKYELQSALSDAFSFDNALLKTHIKTTLPELSEKDFTDLDEFLTITQPWKQDSDSAKGILTVAVASLLITAQKLTPFMPETAVTISDHFLQPSITAFSPLFPRLV